MSAQSVNAATKTWSGATNGNWNNSGNWDALPEANDDLVFPVSAIASSTNNDFTAGTIFNSITINGGGYIFAGNSVSITSNVTDNNSSATSTIISFVITGAGSFAKLGTGTLTLSGTNTFTGGVTLNAGKLNINNNSALGTIAGTFTINGGTIDNASAGYIGTPNYPMAWNGDFSFDGTRSMSLGAGAVTPNGNRTITINGANSYLEIGGVIGGGAISLTKAGLGSLILKGANTYTGVTTILNGSIDVQTNAPSGSPGALGNATSDILLGDTTGSNNASILITGAYTVGRNITVQAGSSGTAKIYNRLTYSSVYSGNITLNKDVTIYTNNVGTTTISGIISGAYNVNVGVTGSNIVVLSGNNTYTGTTFLNNGTLKLGATGDGTNGPLGTTAGGITVSSGTAFDLNGYSLSTAEPLTLSGTGISSGGSLKNSSSTAATYSGLLTLASNSSIIGGTGAIDISNAGTITGSGRNLTLGGAVGGSLTSIIGTGSGTLTKTDAGTWTISGTNTFTGGTTLDAGQLNINNTQALGTVAGTFTINGGTIDNTSAGDITTLDYPMNWNGDFTYAGSVHSLNFGTGAVTMNASRQVTISTNTLTVGGVINNASYNLTKTGAGALALNGATTLNDVTISAGTLSTVSSTFNIAGNWNNSGTFSAGLGTVTLNGTSQTISGTNTFNNLTAIIPGQVVIFPYGTGTTTILGTFKAEGTSGQNIFFKSSEIGTDGTKAHRARVDIAAVSDNNSNAYMQYVTPYDIDASYGSASPIQLQDSTDGGNNLGWNFVVDAVPPNAPTFVTAATSSPNQATITFTPGTDGGSSILYYLASSTPGNFTATSTGSPIDVTGLTNGTAYTFQVYAVNAIGTSTPSAVSNAVTPIAYTINDTIGWWKFDDASGSTAIDSSLTGANASLIADTTPNSPSWVAGYLGSALNFTGTGDYVDAGTNSAYNFTSSDFSVSFWMKASALTGNERLVSRSSYNSNGWSVGIYSNSINHFIRLATYQSGASQIVAGTTNVNTGQWMHVVVTRSGTVGTIYLDGVAESSYTTRGSLSDPSSSSNDLCFGAWDSCSTNYVYGGNMDDVRIYNRALSSDDAASLYSGGVSAHSSDTLTITSPTASSTVLGPVSITVTASTSASIAGVQYRLDDSNLGSETTSSPYTYSWDTTQTADGIHTVTAVLRDISNNLTLSSNAVPITVDNSNPPVISGGLPNHIQYWGTTEVTLQVATNKNATCKYDTNSGTVYASMEHTFTTTGGTTHQGPITGLENGQTYTYYVRCSDILSHVNTSDYTISFNIQDTDIHDFYVSTAGSSSGDGTIGNPWDLTTALEDNTDFSGNNWIIKPGSTVWLRGGLYSGLYNSYLMGSTTGQITVRSYPGEWVIINGGLDHLSGGYTTYRDFEVTHGYNEDGTINNNLKRVSVESTTFPTDIPGYGDSISGQGTGLKFINLIIHDVVFNGISLFSDLALDAEIYGNIIYNVGWDAPDRAHGHNIYVQNDTGRMRISNNILFGAMNGNNPIFQAYGTGAHANNITFDKNITFQGWDQFGGNTPVNGLILTDNFWLYGGAFVIGYNHNMPDQDMVMTGNYILGDISWIQFFETIDFQNNLIQGGLPVSMSITNSTANYSFDNNTYYGGGYGGPRLSDNDEYVIVPYNDFTSWQAQGLDPNSSYIEGNYPNTPIIGIIPNTYDPDRTHIAIYNRAQSGTVPVDLSSVLNVGDSYEIRDVQNYLAGEIASSTYNGGTVDFPMNLTDVPAWIGDFTGATYYTPLPHTPASTGVFVVIRTAEAEIFAPTIITSAASSLTTTSGTLNGSAGNLGGESSTEHGFAWGTSATLSGGDTATTTLGAKSGTGAFTSSLTGLTCNTTYYSRGYATNSAGTGYGTIVSFTTSACPVAEEPAAASSGSLSGTGRRNRILPGTTVSQPNQAITYVPTYPTIIYPSDTGTAEPSDATTPDSTTPVVYTPPSILSSLPSEFLTLIKKFPSLGKTLSNIAVRSGEDVLDTLKSAKLSLPNLSRESNTTGIPLNSLTTTQKQSLPGEVIFARSGDLIDYNVSLTVSDEGQAEQVIHTIAGKSIDLAIKPDKPVEAITGYLTIKNIKRNQAMRAIPNNSTSLDSTRDGSLGVNNSMLLASIGSLLAQNTEEAPVVDEKLVMSKFTYSDTDSDGIYTASITAPMIHGEYDIMTIMEYKDDKLGAKEFHLTTVVDPEGYVYTAGKDGDTRLEKAKVTLWWKNPKTNAFDIWPASNFNQINPQLTDRTGNYSFLVPEGRYKLTVLLDKFYDYNGAEFEVVQGSGVHENIELTKKSWWKSLLKFLGL